MKIRLFLCICILAVGCPRASSQGSWFAPGEKIHNQFLASVKEAHQLQLAGYEEKEALVDLYKWRYGYVESLLDNGAACYNDTLQSYLDEVFRQITQANPELRLLNLRYLVSNSPVPNAFSLGDGTVVINLGLVRKLENEAQLAFIICHEIAHFYLDHGNKAAIARYRQRQSKAYEKEMKTFGSQKFGKYEMIKMLLKKQVYSNMAFSRKQEIEADSAGLGFFKKTLYDPAQAITCMHLLDTIDYYKYRKKIQYPRTLNFENYPFQDKWLEREATMFGGKIENNYWDQDSVKSHPDTRLRAGRLQQWLQPDEPHARERDLQDSLTFFSLRKQSDYEFIESWVFYEDYGRALFFCLKQLESDPQNEVLLLKSARLFKMIYQSQLNHQFSQYVERTSTEHEKEYDEFLNFLDNLRLSELANISFHYHLAHLETLQAHPSFLADFYYLKEEANN